MKNKIKILVLVAFKCLIASNCYAGGDTIRYKSDPAKRWIGNYAGLVIGYSNTAASIDRGAGSSDFDINRDAITIGGLIGTNFSYNPTSEKGGWLFGAEAEFVGLGGKHSKNDATLGEVEIDAKWSGSLRLRAGYAWERLYLYGLAGIAFSDIDVRQKSDKNDDDITASLLLGVGAELAMNDKWSARLDATLTGLGEEDITFSGTSRETASGIVGLRLGITRKF